jgi:restriction system protein
MILDYSQYISQNEEYGMNTGPKKADNESLFFHKREFCVFCNRKTERIYDDPRVDTETIHGVAWHNINSVFSCSCGWWEHTFYGYLEGEREGFKDWAFEVDSAILRQFNIDSNKIPIQSLRQYLAGKLEDIYHIHHKKMEELVASVLSEHYACEAHVVGKSHDGGVDLILIESDQPIVVQVKRRTKESKVEAANQIRELIGATLLQDSRQCIFVTTADHFSSQAVETRNMALKKNLVHRFDLIDLNKFVDLLQLHKKSSVVPWKKLIER